MVVAVVSATQSSPVPQTKFSGHHPPPSDRAHTIYPVCPAQVAVASRRSRGRWSSICAVTGPFTAEVSGMGRLPEHTEIWLIRKQSEHADHQPMRPREENISAVFRPDSYASTICIKLKRGDPGERGLIEAWSQAARAELLIIKTLPALRPPARSYGVSLHDKRLHIHRESNDASLS